MERTMSRPVGNLPETIHSLIGLKYHFTSSWVKSVCDISKNVSSSSEISSTSKEEDESAFVEVQSIRDQLSRLTVQVNDQNKRRREILNEFLDLKGNIRVFCRVKPLDSKNSRAPVSSDTRNVIIKLTESKRKTYNFDRVFQPDSSQDDVFLEIEPVIKSVIDGYNACIFAYGQTGTGKTFTMEGLPESPGIVPRAIKALFKQVEQSNHKFVIKFSMLEIYMGNLRDLLVSQGTKPISPIPPSLLIHTDPKGEIDIENLVTLKVTDSDEVFKLYKLGCRSRATAFTNSNSASSRSHCMIRVSITCAGAPERLRERNKIWLVDLGGSERVLKTKATGRRFDEGKAINLSLSALGDVINSLQRKNAHIPYRNSKLTQVLKDSLGQDSKTLMLVHISRKEDDLCETICSLNFATRAKNIHLGQDESKEERERKETVMRCLQNMMETIEKERETKLKEIRHLNETLEKLSGKPHVIEEVDEIREEIQVTPKLKRNKSRRASDVFSSFMRPTASSNRRLSGADFRSVSNGPGFKSRRNSMAHFRSESVCIRMKDGFDSLCDSSERSISKSTCAISHNRADNAATVYSQEISECDIKLVVCEHNTNVNQKEGGTEFSRINSWLHSQSENRSYLLDKKLRVSRNISWERSSNGSKTLEDIEESKTEIKHPLLLKDQFEPECLCSAETEDQILSKYPNPNPNEEDNGSLHLPSFRYDAWFGVDGSAARKKDSQASGLLLELKQPLPNYQRGLEFKEDVAPPFLGPQGILVQTGRDYTFVQKLEALSLRILLGLGFIDVGYGSNFFNGLTQQ
ncbi:unnamed protein product [Eruca vesicaria subsp. sativa]|uniref:Kinesin motor domain-containing protein n=1 Tax=Eruca vesicaria subsp. sativa TaxID=29727 RepID=A0ABC8M4C2_ERUVS|nr:unnamed protein product [Eruca vesicaria subsp. sativa]